MRSIFAPEPPRIVPTKSAFIRLAIRDSCKKEQDWHINRMERLWLTAKFIVCVLLNLQPEEDGTWGFYSDSVLVASYNWRTTFGEFTGADWEELRVARYGWWFAEMTNGYP